MSESGIGSFAEYRQMTNQVRDDLLKLQNYSKEFKLTQNAAMIDEVLKKSADDSFDVAVIGEFKRGKSTLINALLDQDVLPTDAMPATATLNRVTYSLQPLARIEYRDGTTEDVDIDKLADYVTKLTEESEQKAASVKMATVYYPTSYCKNNVDIIDTPGLNDDQTMADVTMSVLPDIDAALFVIMAQSPFSEYERDFLENKLMSSDLGRIIFVVTGIDRLDEEDVDRVLDSITNRIDRYVIDKAKKLYGEDSEEFRVYKQKIGKPKVFGLSAKQAIKARKKDDPEMLAESRFPEFEKELERFLTEDRGAITLQVQVNRILSSLEEIIKSIQLRESALAMGQQEFQDKYEQSKEKIAEIRKNRDEEFKRIDESAGKALDSLRPQISGFWNEITSTALAVIDSEPISAEDAKKENAVATQERIMKKVQKATEDQGRLLAEKIQVQITEALGKETDRLGDFESGFFEQVGEVQQIFVASGGMDDLTDKENLTTMALGVGAGMIIGGGVVSGVVMGAKEGGTKGALIGGVAGLGGALGVGVLAGLLSMPIAWPVVLVGAVVGAISSKFAVSKFVVGDVSEKFRAQLREAVEKRYQEIAAANNITDSVKKQINDAFDSLKKKVNDETEVILKDLEETLASINKEMAGQQALEEKEKHDLEDLLQDLNGIAGRTNLLAEQLAAVLNREDAA